MPTPITTALSNLLAAEALLTTETHLADAHHAHTSAAEEAIHHQPPSPLRADRLTEAADARKRATEDHHALADALTYLQDAIASLRCHSNNPTTQEPTP